MNLLIAKEYRKEMDTDNYCIKASMLNENGPHLFIASNSWDSIKVELCPQLPANKLEFLPKVCENISVTCSGNYNDYIEHLIALFPNKAGSLRRCLITHSGVESIIKEHTYE